MLLAIGIILFVLGCCMDSAEDREYRAQKRADERHKELMRMLSEENKYSTPRRTRQVRRRFIQDRNGNLLGEEITEEELEDRNGNFCFYNSDNRNSCYCKCF